MKGERNRMNLKNCLANGGYKGIIFEHASQKVLNRATRYAIRDMNYNSEGVNIARIILYRENEKINRNIPLSYLINDRVVGRI